MLCVDQTLGNQFGNVFADAVFAFVDRTVYIPPILLQTSQLVSNIRSIFTVVSFIIVDFSYFESAKILKKINLQLYQCH